MKKLFINAAIIIASSILFNTANISFRVFLSNKIGTEGIGLYQLILSVYMIAVLLVVSGINVAVTRLIAEEGGRSSFSISRALIIRAISVSFMFSIPAFLFLYAGSEYIGTVWLNDERAIFPLKLLSVGMPFAGVSACIKGYFYGVSKILRPTIAQACELTIQILVVIKIIDYFMLGGPEYACAAIAVGITLSELSSCIFILTFYRFERGKGSSRVSKIFQQAKIIKKILYIALPVSASALVRSSLRTVEQLMIPIGFTKYGYTRKIALEEYGQLQGMVMPVLMFPASIIIAFTTLLIPEVSEANSLHQKKRVEYSITRALQLTAIISILIMGVFVYFSDKLGPAIFDDNDCAYLMRILAPLVPLVYLDIVADDLLKALNQQVRSMMYSIADAVLRIGLIYYVLPLKGLDGLIIVMYLSNSFSITLNMARLLSVTQLQLNFKDWIFKPVLAVIASGFLGKYLMDLTGLGSSSDIIYMLAGILLTAAIYFLFLGKLGCLTKEDFTLLRILFNYSPKN